MRKILLSSSKQTRVDLTVKNRQDGDTVPFDRLQEPVFGLSATGNITCKVSVSQKRVGADLNDVTRLRRGAFEAAVTTASKGGRIFHGVGERFAGAHREDALAAFEGESALLTLRKRHRFVFQFFAMSFGPKQECDM